MNLKKSILLISCTHGNEGFSLPIVKRLARKFQLNYLIGNPRALKKNVRFTDTDLNRSGAGSAKSPNYEERRAKQIINKASEYQAAIDIHGTVSNSGIFIIITNPSWMNIELAKKFNIENVVLWPGLLPTGPLTQFIPNSIEIECGPKDNSEVSIRLQQVLEKYLEGKPREVDQSFYIVTGKIKGENNSALTDFVKASNNDIPYYPLLSGNQYPGITCYMMQKLGEQL